MPGSPPAFRDPFTCPQRLWAPPFTCPLASVPDEAGGAAGDGSICNSCCLTLGDMLTLIIISHEDQWEPELCNADRSCKYMFLWLHQLNSYLLSLGNLGEKSHIQQSQPRYIFSSYLAQCSTYSLNITWLFWVFLNDIYDRKPHLPFANGWFSALIY